MNTSWMDICYINTLYTVLEPMASSHTSQVPIYFILLEDPIQSLTEQLSYWVSFRDILLHKQ